ncbi:hypothetical protein [Achromobacter mucicolens]|uniref:hypothetical protein n=1 Tax=Achromobacter mucicolens TaxID=1389922 RepID=UPI0028AC446F|nr:hypothetical protein [Achromobacter mucicolens]
MQIETIPLANRAFDIHNVLVTLRAALPDDAPGELPTACLLTMLVRLSEELAVDLLELPSLLEEPKRGKK